MMAGVGHALLHFEVHHSQRHCKTPRSGNCLLRHKDSRPGVGVARLLTAQRAGEGEAQQRRAATICVEQYDAASFYSQLR